MYTDVTTIENGLLRSMKRITKKKKNNKHFILFHNNIYLTNFQRNLKCLKTILPIIAKIHDNRGVLSEIVT